MGVLWNHAAFAGPGRGSWGSNQPRPKPCYLRLTFVNADIMMLDSRFCLQCRHELSLRLSCVHGSRDTSQTLRSQSLARRGWMMLASPSASTRRSVNCRPRWSLGGSPAGVSGTPASFESLGQPGGGGWRAYKGHRARAAPSEDSGSIGHKPEP